MALIIPANTGQAAEVPPMGYSPPFWIM